MRRALAALAVVLAACGHPRAPVHAAPGRGRPVAAHPSRPSHVAPATVAGVQRGIAVWYASGRMTASGERFDKHAMTAAHRTLPFGTKVRVTVDATGRSVVVRINDRGPFGNPKRIIDLTEAAARKVGIIDAGHAAVTLEILEAR